MSTVTLTGDDYRYRFEVDAKQRFIDSLRERFNTGASYKRGILKWGTLIEQKTDELGRFLTRRASNLDFVKPEPKLEKSDSLSCEEGFFHLLLLKLGALTSGRARFTICGRTRRVKTNSPFTSPS